MKRPARVTVRAGRGGVACGARRGPGTCHALGGVWWASEHGSPVGLGANLCFPALAALFPGRIGFYVFAGFYLSESCVISHYSLSFNPLI